MSRQGATTKLGVDMPSADLPVEDSFNAPASDVIDGKRVGRGVIDGVDCEHLASRAVLGFFSLQHS